MFEVLQADQHAKTGVSQMAVFNDLNAVVAAKNAYLQACNNTHKKAEEHYKMEKTIADFEEKRKIKNGELQQASREDTICGRKFFNLLDAEVAQINSITDNETRKQRAMQLKAEAVKGMDTVYERDYDLRLNPYGDKSSVMDALGKLK
jgi:hypothetical protein